jgi:NADP-dependent 3-hydroxy acid dehydrogenase YdfG
VAALDGTAAVVTGAGTGIGAAIAVALHGAGAAVTLIGRRPEPLAEITSRLGGDRVHACPCDVSDYDAVQAAVEEAARVHGPATILVNNAGINTNPRTVADVSLPDWDLTVAVDLSGVFYCVRAALPAMRAAGGGTIVNIGSTAGRWGSSLAGAAYSSAKHGVVGLNSVINDEESRNGIRCTVILPGEVETPILDRRPEPVSAERRRAMLQPEDVAAATLLAATLPDRACITELVIKPRISYA